MEALQQTAPDRRPRGVFVQEEAEGDEAYVSALLKQCWPLAEPATPADETVVEAPEPTLAAVRPLVHIVEVARPVPMSRKDVASWLSATVEMTDWLVARVREAPDTPLFREHAAFLSEAARQAGYLALPLAEADAAGSVEVVPASACGGESASPVSTTPTLR